LVLLDAVVDEEAHLEQAHKLYKSGNYKQALEHSSAVYERSPQRTDNLLLLGAIYYQVVFHFHLFVRVCYYYYYYFFFFCFGQNCKLFAFLLAVARL
jgi:hypothetical protein